MAADDQRYAIGDLASLGGVSRRTVRYYVQENLLPPPFGVGRGNHYGQDHLDQLRRVKALQEAGRTLDEIRRALADGAPAVPSSRASRLTRSAPPDPARSLWRRLPIARGVELHVEGASRPLSTAALRELATWCERHLADRVDHTSRKDEDPDA